MLFFTNFCELFNIRIFDKLNIHSKMEKPLHRNIGGFRRKPESIKEHTLIISNDNDEYTDNLKKIFKDYHLVL